MSWYERAKASEAGEIGGQISQCVDPAKRDRLRHNLLDALRELFPLAFPLPFSRDHIRVIEIMQRTMLDGGQFAVAMPRGFGKTTMAVRAAMWAILYGHRRSAVLVAASDPLALRILRGVKDELRYNDRLAELFPEACMPVRALEGKAARCQSQTVNGVPTGIVWKADELIMPTVIGSYCSGARFGVAGISGGKIRGQQHVMVTGEVVRPDIVICDDPQDRESAKSPTQTADRLAVINGDILGMAGPTSKISCLIPCTVIQEGDLADQLLDRTKNPQFQGVKTKMLDSMPTNDSLWEQYRDIRARAMREERPADAWNQFLSDNWDAMHAGAVAAWPERHKPDELSAVQSAMNWHFDSPIAFAAEAQNEPLKSATDTIDPITPLEVGDKAIGTTRGVVPGSATRLVAFADVQGKLLPWVVVAFCEDFTAHIVDYGTFPDQKRMIWNLNDAKQTLARMFPGLTQEGLTYEGAEGLSSLLFGRNWVRTDGAIMQLDAFGIDCGWQTDTVYKWSRETAHKQRVRVMRGKGLNEKSLPMSDYKARDGEKLGHHWLSKTVGKSHPTRVIEHDVNYWKTQVYRRLKMSKGETGTLTLFGKSSDHPTLAGHCCAEVPVERGNDSNRVWVWAIKAERPDNHYWDCLVGCYVLASSLGCQMTVTQSRAFTAPKPRKRVTLEELARRARGG